MHAFVHTTFPLQLTLSPMAGCAGDATGGAWPAAMGHLRPGQWQCFQGKPRCPIIEVQNHLGWERPPRSLGPILH